MSRRVIYFLSLTMAVAVFSLIWIQTMTVKEVSGIIEEHFNILVNRALTSVAEKIENEEMNQFLFGEESDLLPDENPGYFPPSTLSKSLSGMVEKGGVTLSFSFTEQIFGRHGPIEKTVLINDSLKIYSKEGGEIGMPDIGIKRYDIVAKQGSFKKNFDRNNMFIKAIEFQKIRSNIPLVERVDSEFLQETIENEFRNIGIQIEYKYAVVSEVNGKAEFVLGETNYKPETKSRKFNKLLFPGDENNLKPNYLYVSFPEHHRYLLKDTGFLVIPSIILTLIIIGTFILTLQIILRQKKVSQIKNDFINNMTHELKTPISTISLASQMLKDSSVKHTPKTIGHVSNVIFDESKRLSYQVEKVLQMAVFNEGRLKLKFTTIDINAILKSVVSNFQLRINNVNGELNSTFSANNCLIKGDEVHITNVMVNLLDNALKYGAEKPVIELYTENKKDWIVVKVIDNGIGISKEHQKQIFERFFRVPTGNLHNIKGFGLGLSYVKRIVEAHSGMIKVESNLGKGSCFKVYLPVKRIT